MSTYNAIFTMHKGNGLSVLVFFYNYRKPPVNLSFLESCFLQEDKI